MKLPPLPGEKKFLNQLVIKTRYLQSVYAKYGAALFHTNSRFLISSFPSVAKLEYLGFQVGQRLVERFTKDTLRFKDELEVMKFLCKDFWCGVFKKQIDNLRTNHMGVYVLQDARFKLLTQISQV